MHIIGITRQPIVHIAANCRDSILTIQARSTPLCNGRLTESVLGELGDFSVVLYVANRALNQQFKAITDLIFFPTLYGDIHTTLLDFLWHI